MSPPMFQLLTPSAIRLQQRDGSATPDDAEDDVVTPAYAGTPACAGAGAEEMSSLDVVLSSEDLHAADAAAAFLRVVDPLAPCPEFPPPNYVGQSLFKFELDPFQKHAVCAIAAGHNVLVTAKTGSGKTAVGEYLIAHCLAQGLRVFYTTPIKSLSNQKFAELRAKFPHASVGLMTGDVKSSPDSQIVVLTQEILRNRLFKIGSPSEAIGPSADLSLLQLGAVVMDEAHYMMDAERGHAWEETIVLLPPPVKLVLLSATISSPSLLASWVGDVRRVPCVCLSTAYRIVPLVHGVITEAGEISTILDAKNSFNEPAYRAWLKGREDREKGVVAHRANVAANRLDPAVAAAAARLERAGMPPPPGAAGRGGGRAGGGGSTPVVKQQSYYAVLNDTIRLLERKELLPALFFVLSRKKCEQYASKIDATLLTSFQSAEVRRIFDFHLSRHKTSLEPLAQYHTLREMLQRGIAFHHSGVLPLLREVVELLFSKGFVKVLFATETFAVGLNMPTKTAVFVDVRKFDDACNGMRVLRTDEYTQMAGRAGRRGIDKSGLVLYVPAYPPLSTLEMKNMMTGLLPALSSQLQLHYDFVLRVLQAGRIPFDLLLERSYWGRQQRTQLTNLGLQQRTLQTKRAALLLSDMERAHCDERAQLEAVLASTTANARKAPQRLIEQWKNAHAGPKWTAAWATFQTDLKLGETEESVTRELEDLQRPASTIRLGPVAVMLRELGFVRPGASDDVRDLGPADLTLKGTLVSGHNFNFGSADLTLKWTLAAGVNESHALLLPEMYLSGLLREASGEDVVAALGCFITDKEAEDKSPPLHAIDVSERVRAAVRHVGEVARRCQGIEAAFGMHNPSETYWVTREMWVDVGIKWMRGESVSAICTEYEMFEGNLLKGILKLNNSLTEWVSLATFCEHVDVLDRLRDTSSRLLRDIAQVDSLYLRI